MTPFVAGLFATVFYAIVFNIFPPKHIKLTPAFYFLVYIFGVCLMFAIWCFRTWCLDPLCFKISANKKFMKNISFGKIIFGRVKKLFVLTTLQKTTSVPLCPV
jgi:hypothetical protein